MIRILHYGLSPNRGGIETYLNKLWSQIDKAQIHFDFVDEWGGRVYFRKEFEKMGSYFYPITPRREALLKNLYDWDKLFSEQHFDILHCHLNTLSYTAPIYSALLHKIPVIVHSRSTGASITKPSLLTKLLHTINRIYLPQNHIYKLAVSTEAGQWLFGEKAQFTVINNGVNINQFAFSEHSRNKIRNELGIVNDSLVIGNVASLVPVKNQSFLLDIFREIKNVIPNAYLLIAGEGNQRSFLTNKISLYGLSESVFLLGNRSDIPELLSAMDIFVLTSIFEGFPNAALEAQTSGLPCVLSNTITKEISVLSCEFLPITESASMWAKTILSIELNKQREIARLKVQASGKSVEEELEVIMNYYRKIVEKKK